MDPDLGGWLAWLRSHGVRFRTAAPLARDPDQDGPTVQGAEAVRTLRLEGMAPLVEHRDPVAGISADHATESVAREMIRRPRAGPGVRVVEVGCGTGVLAVLAAAQGAAAVTALDVDPRALDLARRTAAAAGARIRLGGGSLLEALPPGEAADLFIANLPHKPVPDGTAFALSQAGGPEGDRVHGAFLDGVRDRMGPGARVLFFLHSLPHPRLLRRYGEEFDLVLLSWKRRFLQRGEFGPVVDLFEERAREGTSFLGRAGGRTFLAAGVWEAVRGGGSDSREGRAGRG